MGDFSQLLANGTNITNIVYNDTTHHIVYFADDVVYVKSAGTINWTSSHSIYSGLGSYGTYILVTMNRISSYNPNATLGNISINSEIFYGDQLRITLKPYSNYSINTSIYCSDVRVNGSKPTISSYTNNSSGVVFTFRVEGSTAIDMTFTTLQASNFYLRVYLYGSQTGEGYYVLNSSSYIQIGNSSQPAAVDGETPGARDVIAVYRYYNTNSYSRKYVFYFSSSSYTTVIAKGSSKNYTYLADNYKINGSTHYGQASVGLKGCYVTVGDSRFSFNGQGIT